MIQRIVFSIVLTGLILLNLGCEKDRDSRVIVSPAGNSQIWGVLIYAAGNYPGDELAESVNGTFSRAVNTVRELELLYTNDQIVSYACLSSTEMGGNVGVFNIGFHPQTGDSLLGSTLIRDLGPMSTADPATLREFLATALEAIEADHYALVLAGDGDGWFGTMGDQVQPTGMPLTELRATIGEFSGSLPNGKLDLLCLYSKDMGAVETLIELRDQARWAVTYPWKLEQPHHLIVKEWYRDLIAQPELNAEGLGAYMVDAERLAQDLSSDSVFVTLWNMDAFANIENAFENFAAQWSNVAPQNGQVLTSLRNSATNVNLYDSVYVDLASYANQIAAASQFSAEEFAALRSTATELSSAILQARTSHIGSAVSDSYSGLNFFFPTGSIDTLTAQAYSELRIGSSVPSWNGVIDSLSRRGNTDVTISGQAYWSGREFYNVNFFVDTLIGGAFSLMTTFEPQWEFANESMDTINYQATFSVGGLDSLRIEIGLFIDHDVDNVFNAGDSLGFWNDGSSNLTPFTVHSGEMLADRNITIRFRRQ